MKRVLWGLLVVCFMLFAVAPAFASDAESAIDTGSYVVEPDPGDYKEEFEGVVVEKVYGFSDLTDSDGNWDKTALTTILGTGFSLPTGKSTITQVIEELTKALDVFLGEQIDEDGTSNDTLIAMLVLKLEEDSATITYNWANNEFLYDFVSGKLFNNAGTEVSTSSVSVKQVKDLDSKFLLKGASYPAKDSDVMIVIAENLGEHKEHKSSSGCSAFPAAAFALFFLPALALTVKRGKK